MKRTQIENIVIYKITATFLIVCSFLWMTACSSTDVVTADLTPAEYVNPFIGASTSVGAAGVYHGLGKTFPEQPLHTAWYK